MYPIAEPCFQRPCTLCFLAGLAHGRRPHNVWLCVLRSAVLQSILLNKGIALPARLMGTCAVLAGSELDRHARCCVHRTAVVYLSVIWDHLPDALPPSGAGGCSCGPFFLCGQEVGGRKRGLPGHPRTQRRSTRPTITPLVITDWTAASGAVLRCPMCGYTPCAACMQVAPLCRRGRRLVH